MVDSNILLIAWEVPQGYGWHPIAVADRSKDVHSNRTTEGRTENPLYAPFGDGLYFVLARM